MFNDLSLSNLPCFGSRAAIAGWYSVVDDALRASDWTKVLKLYRAALCVPLRLRCAPSLTQVSRDSMTYSEELFAANPHCSDVFLAFAEKFMAAVPPDFVQSETVKNIVARARTLGISFHGSAVGDGVARALINVAPFVTSPEFRKAFKSFEAISPALNDHTKISSLTCACTKTYGKASLAAAEASVAVLDTLRAGLLYKDITESQLTKEFITGLPNKGGFVHSIFQRIALVDFVQLIVHNSHGKAFADEAKEKIFTKLSSVAAMEEHLAGQFTHAGSSGVEQVLPRVRRATFGRLTSAVGEIDEDEPEPDRLTGVGLSFATMIGFGNFSESLSYSGRLLATLLWKTHGYAFDEEFRQIAALEKSNPQYPFSWRDLFSPLPRHTVGALSLPLLRDTCGAWIQSTLSQPILGVLGEAKSTIGDQDHASSKACQINSGAFAAKRQITNNALDELFRDRVMLSSMPRAMFTHHNIMQVLQQCRHDWPTVRGNAEANVASISAVGDGTTGVKSNVASPSAVGDGDTGVPSIEQEKNGTMYLCCAELFPDHAILSTCDTFRGIPIFCSTYFKETVKLLLVIAEDDDVVIVSDGRSDLIQRELRSIFRTMAGPDDFVELWVIYDQETSMGKDVRNPKRKLPWSSQNMEVLFVKLPKSRRKLVSRGLFNKCGESTNFSRSFTGVPFRNLAEIPRLTPNAKKIILGKAAVGAFDEDRVDKEVLERGHPLFWGEWKPVTLYSTLIHDFQIDYVVDLTPGSGAACLASLYSKVLYTGIAYNAKHEEWLRHLLRRMFVAMVMSNHVVADAGLVQNVTTYLNYSPEAAKCMLPKFAAAFGDSLTGVDDSDGE